MTRATIFLVATMITGGCTMSSSSRRATMMAGGVLALGGIVVIRSAPVDADGDGRNELVLDDDLGAYAAGTLMFLAGTVAFLAALASREADDDVRAMTPSAAAPSTTMPAADLPATSPTREPEDDVQVMAPSAATPSTTHEAPARQVIVERVPAVPLPDLPTSTAAERLARQVRSACTHGHCQVAWIMWADLEKLDPIYARAVRDGPVMARCAE